MSNRRAIGVALAVSIAVGLAGVASATAAPAGWMLNGKRLSEEGLTSAAVKSSTITDSEYSGLIIIHFGGINCRGMNLIGGVVKEVNQLLASSIEFTGCVGKTCTVPTTIGTVPVVAEFTLEGALAAKGLLKPESGTVFTTIAITECVPSGAKALTGDIPVLAATGQDERTDQALLLDVHESESLLFLGGAPTGFSGRSLLLLANDQPWSFL